jgi:hypothetical protein
MNMTHWRDLAVTSVQDPAAAARDLMSMQIPREALWTGLFLVAILNTLLFVLSNILVPGPSPLPEALSAPTFYFAIVFGGLVMTVYAIFYVGRWLGGTGSVADLMVLIVWLQALRVAVQAAALVLMIIFPLLSALLVFAASLVGFYIMLHFIKQAHRLGSLWGSFGVLILAIFAILIGMSVLLSLVGGPFLGASAYV